MKIHQVGFKIVIMLTLFAITLASAQQDPLETSSQHALDVRYNVALVEVSADFSATAGGPSLLDSAVVFDNSQWSTIGLPESETIDRFSSIDYTLAHKSAATANTVSVLLTLPGAGTDAEKRAAFAALRVSLAVSPGSSRPGVIGSSVTLKEYNADPTPQTIIQTTEATKGVAAQNVPLRYSFTIDVTAGPAFPASTLTLIYTATAAAP